MNSSKKILTSLDAPIYINIFPPEILPLKGTIGMTMAPGKKGQSIFALWDRDLDTDLELIKSTYKTDIIISLMEDFEFDLAKIPNFKEKCKEKSIENIRFQIVNSSIPEPHQKQEYVKLALYVKEQAENGKNVVIHCLGGIGRTGTLAACILVLFGYSSEDAIKITRRYRNRAIETKIQEEFVEEFRKIVETEKKK